MPTEAKPARLQPLVPPQPVPDPAQAQLRGLEMLAASNRLAFGWLEAATAQHAAVTRLALGRMAATARRLAAAEAPADQARAMLQMLDEARADGLRTAEELAALARRMQEETLGLLDRVVKRGD